MSEDDSLRADVISQVMCYDKLWYADIERRHGVLFRKYFASELQALESLQADGLVEIEPFGLTILPKGRFLRRAIAKAFDAYLAKDGVVTRHSKML